jgi:hypothetical protein
MAYSPGPVYYQGADLVLEDIGAPRTRETVNAVVAWEIHEWGTSYLATTLNPMATSLVAQGARGRCRLPDGRMTSEPCYDTIADGAAACAKTLLGNKTYAPIVQALRAGDVGKLFGPSCRYAFAVWGGGYGSPSYGYQAAVYAIYRQLPPPPARYLGQGTEASTTTLVIVGSLLFAVLVLSATD